MKGLQVMKALSKNVMSYLTTAVTVMIFAFLFSFASSAADISIPKGAKEYNGHSYYVYSGTYTWKKAKSLCEEKGGHLVVITSKKENKFVAGLIKKKDVGFCWLGASDEKKEGNWVWVDGTKMKYSSWAKNQPDNLKGKEDYISSYTNATKWNDKRNNKSNEIRGYVCEWDITKAEVKKPELSKSKLSLYYGATSTLKMLNTESKVKWTSSNKNVATVSSKGKVTAKGLGTAKITAKIGKKTYKCTVTVKDRNVGSAIGFVTEGGGLFIKGSSVAKITFRPKNYSCAKAVVSIKNASGNTVLTKTYTGLKKNTNYTFTWDGGNAVSGSYRVTVKIGDKISYSPYLNYKAENDFSGGIGSASNPFRIASAEQLSTITKYPNAHFIQVSDLDFSDSSAGNLFSEEVPFNGTYNGNGKIIKNILSDYPIFNYVSAKAKLEHITITDSVFNTDCALVKHNYGKIANCNVDATVTLTSDSLGDIYMGIICSYNNGIISDCTVSGSASASTNEYQKAAIVGGIAGSNNGKIISCISNANVTAEATNNYWGGVFSGGIAGNNNQDGLIEACVVSGEIKATDKQDAFAGNNDGHVLDCTDNTDNKPTNNENTYVTYESERDLYFLPEKKYVKYIGRTVYQNNTLWFSMSGSGAEFITFGNSAEISFKCEGIQNIASHLRPRIQITVNGEIYFNETLKEENQLVYLDLSKITGDKVIRIIKLSESMYSACGINNIHVFDDRDIIPTKEKKLKIEFIGDSYTAGYGIDEENRRGAFSTDTENFSKTYAYLTAEKLNADYSAVAFSGYGVICGQNIPEFVITRHYEKATTTTSFEDVPSVNQWSFTDFEPNVVVINLGVNDVMYCDTEEKKESFTEEYKKLLTLVRLNNKNAHILCVHGETKNTLFPYIEKAVKAYKEETGDNKVYCDTLDFEMRNYATVIHSHPSADSHIKASEKLTIMIEDILKNQFLSSYERD